MNTKNRLQQLKLLSSSSSIVLIATIIIVAILNNDQQRRQIQAAVRKMDFPTVIRRLDCSAFCRRTKFNGYVGGCHCGFTLFSRKRSFQPPLPPMAALEPLQSSMTYMGDYGEQRENDETEFNMPAAMLKLSTSSSSSSSSSLPTMKEYSDLNTNSKQNPNNNNPNKLYMSER
ncbi:hypothetical protein HUG17_6218 [Dermatophagoides farinae]|uniref:Uncharacterized protein n=1 Tax=Dermatophagoides farinae TaxID=6954 RepID=A0A9D4P345_DERFA|nr:hypothetical protein HUG17_6218 [Dermatophagoides farinae]